jgi:hypothetical protein
MLQTPQLWHFKHIDAACAADLDADNANVAACMDTSKHSIGYILLN